MHHALETLQVVSQSSQRPVTTGAQPAAKDHPVVVMIKYELRSCPTDLTGTGRFQMPETPFHIPQLFRFRLPARPAYISVRLFVPLLLKQMYRTALMTFYTLLPCVGRHAS